MTIGEAAAVMGGRLAAAGERAQEPLGSVVVDSRLARPGSIFFCIRGERADGHDFAAKAAEAGAAAVVAERELDRTALGGAALIVAEDAVKALGALAHAHRLRSRATVIGVTGTAGKTTVKECLAQVLGEVGPTSKNHLNFNNQIGLPLSILAASPDDAFWVMEAGISRPGDMDELGAILQPDLALVLNVGAGHTAGLGDLGVAHYKSLFLLHLAPGGKGLINADYPELVRSARGTGADFVMFSSSGRDALYRGGYIGAELIASASSGARTVLKSRYRLWLDGEHIEVDASLSGRSGVENVTAVAAAAHLAGLSKEDIKRGFENLRLPPQRFECRPCGSWIAIDDTYNANPLSCERALEAARSLASGRPLTLVMGEMGELGAEAARAHRLLGERMGEARPECIFWKGGWSEAVRDGLGAANWKGVWRQVEDGTDFMAAFGETQPGEGVILFKGSRFNHMERLFEAFSEQMRGPDAV